MPTISSREEGSPHQKGETGNNGDSTTLFREQQTRDKAMSDLYPIIWPEMEPISIVKCYTA
jgi:hypothetical protein